MREPNRGPGRSRRLRLGVAAPRAWALLAVSIALYLAVRALIHPSMVDLVVYRAEGAAVAAGVDLYGPLGAPHDLRATYPPFAALLFTAFIVPPYEVLRDVAVAANIALLFVAALLSCRLVGVDGRHRTTVAVAVTALSIWAEPVFTTFRYGQINVLLLVLILADFTRPPTARTRGLALGIAAGIKVTPGIFVLYLLLTRRFREAAVAVAAFLATVGIGFAALPDASRRFWTDLVFEPTRVGRLENAANQSVRGLIVRITHTRETDTVWFVLIAAVAVAGMVCAVFAYRRLGDRWGLPVCAVTGLLMAPIAWSHHWVWCVPIAVLLWADVRWAIAAVGIFWTFAVWYVPHVPFVELHFAPWQTALSAWYILFGVAFVACAAWQARRAAPAAAGRGPRRHSTWAADAGSTSSVR